MIGALHCVLIVLDDEEAFVRLPQMAIKHQRRLPFFETSKNHKGQGWFPQFLIRAKLAVATQSAISVAKTVKKSLALEKCLEVSVSRLCFE